MESDFPSNSRSSKARTQQSSVPKGEEKNVEKVVSGEVIHRNKSLGKRFKEAFISGPDIRSVVSSVWISLLIPAGKDLFMEALNAVMYQRLWGDAGYRGGGYRPSSMRPGGYTPYNRPAASHISRYRPPTVREDIQPPPAAMSRRGRANFDFGEILLETRIDAMEVLDELQKLIDRFQQATVVDLYDLLGIDFNYTENKWGWTDLSQANVVRTRTGQYLLDLPRPEPIE